MARRGKKNVEKVLVSLFYKVDDDGRLSTAKHASPSILLAILPAGAGKTFLVMMQAKMYHSHLMTMMVLPLSGLHQDLERRARQHEVSIARWMPGEKFNSDVMMIFVSVEHAGFEEFLMYVTNNLGRLLILTTTPTGTLWNSVIVANWRILYSMKLTSLSRTSLIGTPSLPSSDFSVLACPSSIYLHPFHQRCWRNSRSYPVSKVLTSFECRLHVLSLFII
jgi:hypothetical protein